MCVGGRLSEAKWLAACAGFFGRAVSAVGVTELAARRRANFRTVCSQSSSVSCHRSSRKGIRCGIRPRLPRAIWRPVYSASSRSSARLICKHPRLDARRPVVVIRTALRFGCSFTGTNQPACRSDSTCWSQRCLAAGDFPVPTHEIERSRWESLELPKRVFDCVFSSAQFFGPAGK